MADILGIFNHIQQQGEKGKQSRLARMLGEAYNAPMGQRQDALGRIAQVDGRFAMEAEKSFMGADAEAYKQLSERAKAVVSMWPHNPQMAQQAYASMLPLAQRAGINNAPQQLDETLIEGLTKLASIGAGSDEPATYRSAKLMAIDAGYKPGTPEYERAMRVALRTEAGYSPSARRTITVDINGKPTTLSYDPAEDSYTPAVIGGYGGHQTPPQGYAHAPQTQFTGPDGVPTQIDPSLPPEVQAAIRGNPQGWAQAPDQSQAHIGPQSPAPQQPSASGPPAYSATGMPGIGQPIVGRTKEDEAAAVEAATQRVRLGYLPHQMSIEAEGAAGKAGAEGLAKSGVEYYDALNEKAAKASTEDARLQQLEYALSRTYSGFGAEQLLTLRSAAAAFGIGDADKLSAGELARSISNQMALGLRNPAGGEGMPGSMSNEDRRFLQRSVAGIANSPDGWRQMIQMRRQLNSYAIQQSKVATQYLANGGDPARLRAYMQQWADQNPLFAAPGPAPREDTSITSEITGLANDARQGGARRARNPQTGEMLELRNGQWVPVQ